MTDGLPGPEARSPDIPLRNNKRLQGSSACSETDGDSALGVARRHPPKEELL